MAQIKARPDEFFSLAVKSIEGAAIPTEDMILPATPGKALVITDFEIAEAAMGTPISLSHKIRLPNGDFAAKTPLYYFGGTNRSYSSSVGLRVPPGTILYIFWVREPTQRTFNLTGYYLTVQTKRKRAPSRR